MIEILGFPQGRISGRIEEQTVDFLVRQVAKETLSMHDWTGEEPSSFNTCRTGVLPQERSERGDLVLKIEIMIDQSRIIHAQWSLTHYNK